MPHVDVAVRRTLPLFAGLVALYLACLAVVRSGILAQRPDVLALAVTTDLTLTATLVVWWFGVRRGLLPRGALAATTVLGLCAAMLMLPQVRGASPRALVYAWAALEIVALGALLVRARAVAREVRRACRAGVSFPQALEGGIAGALGRHPAVARLLANELAVVCYASCGWLRRPRPASDREMVFAHAGLPQWRATLWAIALLLAGEGVAMHVLLSMWSPTAAWIVSGSELYALLWLVGDYQLLRMNPVRLTPLALHIELGLRGRAAISLDAIAAVRLGVGSANRSEGLVLCPFGEPDIALELHTEIAVTRGLKRIPTRRIDLRAGGLGQALADLGRP
jgi:hypothetical protein